MIEKEINGKTYGFVFNFYALGIAEETLNKPIDDILKSLSPEKDDKGKDKNKGPVIKTICALLYGGAVNYCEMKGKEVDFKVNDMGDWITEIGFGDSMRILTDAISIMQPKNIQPPQTVGEMEKAGELVNI